MKRVTKIVTFYDDGTFTESVPYVGAPMPLTPLSPPFPPFPSVESKQSCPKCGLKLEGVMGYCCPHSQCPTGLGGSWCSTGDIV